MPFVIEVGHMCLALHADEEPEVFLYVDNITIKDYGMGLQISH